MFGAKLFSVAAVAIALIALAPIWPSLLMIGTYFVVWRHAILTVALLCGLFAGFYYFADSISGPPTKQSPRLGSFSIVGVLYHRAGLGSRRGRLHINLGYCRTCSALIHRWWSTFPREPGEGNGPEGLVN